MAIFYVVGCLIILGINYDYIIPAIKTICRLAFTPGAGSRRTCGNRYSLRHAVWCCQGAFFPMNQVWVPRLSRQRRQKTRNPVRQALVSSTGTFWDTVVVCLMTGLVLVSTIMKILRSTRIRSRTGGELTTLAFGQIRSSDRSSLLSALFHSRILRSSAGRTMENAAWNILRERRIDPIPRPLCRCISYRSGACS